MEIILRPEDILDHKYLKQYKSEVETIHSQLVAAQNSLIVIQRIEDFPFRLFTGERKPHFWQLTFNALFETTIMSLSRILDESKNYKRVTLPILKKNVSETYIKSNPPQDLLNDLIKKLDAIDLDNFKSKLKVIRHSFYAHLDYDYHIRSKTPPSISLSDLEEIVLICNELLQLLMLGTNSHIMLWGYSNRKDHEIDVDKILDDIVKRSYWVDNDNEWKWEKEDRLEEFMKETKEDQAIINRYRTKFGLDPL